MLFMFFVILVDDVYCVAIHDLSPVLTALFSIELGGFNSQHRVVAVSQHIGCCRQSTQPVEEVNSLFYVQSQKRLICDDPVWFGALVRADVL